MTAVATVCPNRFALPNGLAMPYCSNGSLDTADPAVRRAVVVIHGDGRNASSYYSSVSAAAASAGVLSETLIIAPHFLTEEDIDSHAPGNDVPFWTDDSWKQGDSSLSTDNNPRPAPISSFDVVDLINDRLRDRGFFPNAESFVIVGHSAGGQFVNRYAAGSIRPHPGARYIVANPASYLYLNDRRRRAGTLDQFAIPQPGCRTYNNYKYGLNALNPYMTNVGATSIRTQYGRKQVVYLLGTEDNDPNHPELNKKNCAENLQGDHRFERGTIYFNHVQAVYGPKIRALHSLVEVPGVGHSAGQMFKSPEGTAELFPPLLPLPVPLPPPPPPPDASTVQAAALLLLDDGPSTAPRRDEISHHPGSTLAGATITGTIKLAQPASTGGRIVTFENDDPAHAVASPVNVPAGATTSPFTIRIADTAAGTSVQLTARSGFVKRTRLTVPDHRVRHVQLGHRPGQAAPVLGLLADGPHLYATRCDATPDGRSDQPGELITLDAATMTISARLGVGFQPRNIAINPQTRHLYVVNSGLNSYSISVLDLTDPTRPSLSSTIDLGQIPIDIAVDPRTNRIFVTNPFQSRIHVIDGAHHVELEPIDTGPGVGGLVHDPASNRLRATRTQLADGQPQHRIVTIAADPDGSFEVEPSPPWPLTGSQPIELALDATTRRLYVATLGSPAAPPTVAVFDADSLTLRTTIRTIANPHAIAVGAQRRLLYIGTDAGLQIADTVTSTIVTTIPKPAPWTVAAADTTVFFGSAREGTVSTVAAPDLTSSTRWTDPTTNSSNP